MMKFQHIVWAFCMSTILGLSACGEQKNSVPTAPAAQLMSTNHDASDEEVSEMKPKKERKTKAAVPFAGRPVDINTASAEEMVAVLKGTGVGVAKVKKIIAYREEHGGFKSVEELTEVKGIGDKTLEKMRERVTISGKVADKSKNKPVSQETKEEKDE